MKTADQLFAEFDGNIREMLRCARDRDEVVVVSHMGGFGSGRLANSLESMTAVADSAPVVFETDIRSSSDGVDFLLHDATLDGLTTGAGSVAASAWDEIAQLYLQSDSGVASELHPSRFDELLEWAERRAFLMLDLKSPSSIESLVKSLAERNMLDAAIFIAYDSEQFEAIRTHAPNTLVALGANNDEQLDFILRQPEFGVLALTGDLRSNPEMYAALSRHNQYGLAGTYFDPQPIDGQVAQGQKVPELESANLSGVQLLVSNEPVALHSYLSDNGQYLQSSSCSAPVN